MDNFWGELVRSIRTESGVSLRRLSALTDIPRAKIARIEDGGTPADIRMVEKMLVVMGYELEALRSDNPVVKHRLDSATDQEDRVRRAVATILNFRAI